MEEVVSYLKKSGMQYLATIGLDGKPKVRPFQFMFEEDGKLWFCTSNQKEIYKELKKQAYIELCAAGEKMSWLRLKGKVIFCNDIKIKERVFEESPLVKGIYKAPDNPAFEVFYLQELIASITELGKPAVIYKL
jgi:uncharacterized pyridoxamine 5'-phosphate oxidase family protein